MKKLILSLSVTVIGFAASAASINWSFSWATDANGDNIDAGSIAYLVNAADYSQADASSAFKAGTFDKSKVLDTASITVDADNGSAVNKMVTAELTGEQAFYAIIATDKFFAMTDTKTVSIKSVGTTTVGWGELSDEDGTSFVQWADVGGGGNTPDPGPVNPPTPDGPGGDVPEPTSGILLMIGGAALALRRRQ